MSRRSRVTYPRFTIISEDINFAEGRGVATIRFAPAHTVRDSITAITAISAYAQRLGTEARPHIRNWAISVELSIGDIGQMVERRDRHGMSRRFTSLRQIRSEFPQALSDAITMLGISGREHEFHDIFATFYIGRLGERVRGRLPANVRRAIVEAKVGGLAKYPIYDGYCGYQAVLYAFVLNDNHWNFWKDLDITWYTSCFRRDGPRASQQLKNAPIRFKRLCIALRRMMNGPANWIVSGDIRESTAQKFVEMCPRMQIVIYNQCSRQVMEKRTGSEYDPLEQPDNTIALSYTLGHVCLIKSIHAFMSKAHRMDTSYCYDCHRFVRSRTHPCNGRRLYCDRCYLPFKTVTKMKKHTSDKLTVKCDDCDEFFYSRECRDTHRCLRRMDPRCETCQRVIKSDHDCGKYKCSMCGKQVRYGHRCFIEVLPEPKPEPINYYAFDCEAMLIPNEEGEGYRHEVNLVVVKKCFAEESAELVFRDMKSFIRWVEELEEPAELFAHNLMGYDGRLVFDHLFLHSKPPQEMIWKGAKILYMCYGKATFRDTLPHLSAALEELPKMFGLDTSQFEKGFFPYLFNKPEFQNYIGPLPAEHYFDPDNMKAQKREQFHRWYSEQQALQPVYNFQDELLKYCVSDVRILAKSIEVYVKTMMEVKPLNPLDSKTIAGYAMKMYRTYYMPENSIAALTAQEHIDIGRAMHGGRTEVRRMLREWSEEELREGKYGKYVDVQSLYPTVQFYDPLPVGIPRRVEPESLPTVDELKKVFGFVCCDIEPTEYLYHPVLVELREGKLMADLLPKENIVVPTPELHLALEHGYKVTRVYWYYHFDQSTELFKGYMRTFIKMKVEASGMPAGVDWEEFDRNHREMLGIHLDRAKVKKNPALRTGVKLLCNSLWGKFGERSKLNKWKRFDADDIVGIHRLEQQWFDGEIDIKFRKQNTSANSLGILYQQNAVDEKSMYAKMRRAHANIALAAMITSHARTRLWKMLHYLGKRVIYHDTDSIIYEHVPGMPDIPEGDYLGDWGDELGGDKIIKFAGCGPKSYAYVTLAGKEVCKVKGFTLNYKNERKINYETMRQLVVGEAVNIETDSLLFKHDREAGEMITKMTKKAFTATLSKGVLQLPSYRVEPFGFERFKS